MNDPQLPQAWMPPDWHPDFGDSKAESEHLRSLAVAVLSAIPRAAVKLETPEPGLMYLSIQMPDGTVTEVHSLEKAHRRFGIFPAVNTPNEREMYADSVDEAVRLIADHQQER